MEAMREFLRGSLARSLRTMPREDRLSAALPVVCGSALGAHCAVARLDDGMTLHLQVLGREWLAPLLAMREVLQHDLARVAGVPLCGLHFEVAGATPPRGPWKREPQAGSAATAGAEDPGAGGAPRGRNRRVS